MPKVQNYPLNKRWCEESSNKINFTNTEFQNGIAYKGSIVSNQLNGVSYVLSQILQFNQATGGYYSNTMTYFKGNFVDIIHIGLDHPMQRESYICIDDAEGAGITNRAPVKDAIIDNQNGVEVYSGGSVNSQYWRRVDIGASQKIVPQEVNISEKPEGSSFLYMTELLRLPSLNYTEGDEPIKNIESNIWITTHLGNKSYSVNMKINGTFVLNAKKTAYNAPKDYFNMPVPNVSFGEVIWNDGESVENSYQPKYELSYTNVLSNASVNANSLYNGTITPYGFNVIVGYSTSSTGQRFWALYLGFQEADKVTMSGESTIALSLNNQVNSTNITICNVIPVRPNGGANGYKELMELREYDTPSNTTSQIMLHYSKGEIELRNARVITQLGLGAYWILSRMQSLSNPTLKEHTGRHTRAYGGEAWETDGSIYAGSKPGELLEPGLPLIDYIYHLGAGWQGIKGPSHMGYSGSIAHCGVANNYGIAEKNFNDVRTKTISITRYIKAF